MTEQMKRWIWHELRWKRLKVKQVGEGDSDQEISLGPAEPDMLDIHVKMLRRERDQ